MAEQERIRVDDRKALHPGQIALHLMPRAAYSTATARVRPTTAALDAQ